MLRLSSLSRLPSSIILLPRQVLEPLEHFSTPEAREAYPAVATGNQVQHELEMISLAAK